MKIRQNQHLQFFYTFFFFFLLFLPPPSIKAQDTLIYTADEPLVNIGHSARFFVDPQSTLSFEQVQALPDMAFEKSKVEIMNFRNTRASIWLKLFIKNQSEEALYLSFGNTQLQHIHIFTYNETGQLSTNKIGIHEPFLNRSLKRGNAVLKIGNRPQTVYINVRSHSSISLPITLSSLTALSNRNYEVDLFSGLCIGIALAMAFYNLFIFFSIRDTLYVYYFAYVVCSIWVISQLNGVWEFYSWHDNAQRHRLCYGECLCVIAIFFTMRFLNTRKDMPYGHYILIALIGLLAIGGFLVTVIDFHPFSNIFSQSVSLITALTMLIMGIVSYKRGNKSAKFYVLAWTGLTIGSAFTLLALGGILPFNTFTANSFTIGTCLENVLLGFALANRINIYRDESEKAQLLALQRLEENEQLIKEQNKLLEEKVQERTETLQNTLHQLQSTESQLVQSEKMAALGELTAGIAHEINNPINFISSSIPPLKRDIEALDELINKYEGLNADNLQAKLQEISDFKEEIDYDYTKEEITLLLSSITDGTNRTTEIVKGLRNFARLDEADQKRASINEGLESTILLMQSSFKKKNIQLIKELGDIPKIACYPGQLNQVFMNILNNAVQAMPEKGTISIKTRFCPETDSIKINLSDTGTGMSEAVKNKIFQPFFTTKDVGEGTGLGLSISYGIVKKHKGTIEVESEEGKGTTFVITLPKGEKLVQ